MYSRILEASHDRYLHSRMPHVSDSVIIVMMSRSYLIPIPYTVGTQEPINYQAHHKPASRWISCVSPSGRPLKYSSQLALGAYMNNFYIFEYRDHQVGTHKYIWSRSCTIFFRDTRICSYIDILWAITNRKYATVLSWMARISMSLYVWAIGCRLETEAASCKAWVFPEQEREGKS